LLGQYERLEDVRLLEALVLPEEGARPLQVVLTPGPGTVEVHSERDGAWTLHATARARIGSSARAVGVDLEALRRRCSEAVDMARLHAGFDRAGVAIGPAFALTSALSSG